MQNKGSLYRDKLCNRDTSLNLYAPKVQRDKKKKGQVKLGVGNFNFFCLAQHPHRSPIRQLLTLCGWWALKYGDCGTNFSILFNVN